MKSETPFVIQFGCLVAYRGNDPTVEIPSGVTVIGRRSFFRSNVHTVILPDSVTEIESEAFLYAQLQSIEIRGSIQKMGTNAFPGNDTVDPCICAAIPIRSYTRAAQNHAVRLFSKWFPELDADAEIFRDNLRFIGTHLKQPQEYGNKRFYHYLLENAALRHAVLAADAIPAKDLKWLIAAVQEEGFAEITAELLGYQKGLLSNEKVRKSLEGSEKRGTKKALSAEMSVADWRKLLKFSYEDGSVVIKEVKIREPVIELPDHIGAKPVRVIGSGAFAYYRKAGETELWSPEKIILPEGITEIRAVAFDCAMNTEIFFPNTVKSLPEDCFCAVENLTLHIPATVTEIADELEFDSGEPAFKAICAPAGSYAEQYAKEHDIPFAAE